jgi:hypothetical protein
MLVAFYLPLACCCLSAGADDAAWRGEPAGQAACHGGMATAGPGSDSEPEDQPCHGQESEQAPAEPCGGDAPAECDCGSFEAAPRHDEALAPALAAPVVDGPVWHELPATMAPVSFHGPGRGNDGAIADHRPRPETEPTLLSLSCMLQN